MISVLEKEVKTLSGSEAVAHICLNVSEKMAEIFAQANLYQWHLVSQGTYPLYIPYVEQLTSTLYTLPVTKTSQFWG